MISVKALCVGREADTGKESVDSVIFAEGKGIEGDSSMETGLVGVLSFEEIKTLRRGGTLVKFGAFGENIVIDGIESDEFSMGERLELGEALLEIVKAEARPTIGVERRGSLYVPRVAVAARVLRGGELHVGEEVHER